jgi:galactonate dehydratase
MKITGFRAHLVGAHRANFIFFKFTTNAGIEGLGEATVEWMSRST